MPGIFISYRREDSFAYAGRLCDRLISHFGRENVFMDVDNIEPGLDFVEVLQRTVSSCDALVAVIGNQWLTATDEEGHPRLYNPQDLVRLEIAAALDRKVRVVPTLVAGAHMPRRQDLPEGLASLARRNALEISDLAFHQSVDRLIEALDKIVGRAADPVPTTLKLLGKIFGDLPTGPFGAIIRLCVAAIILLALIAIAGEFTIKKPELVLQIALLMFLFFMTSVVVYVIRPPDDRHLASGQRRRLRQIHPQRIV